MMTLDSNVSTPAPAEAAPAVEAGASAQGGPTPAAPVTTQFDPSVGPQTTTETQPQPAKVTPLVGRPPLKRPSNLADEWLQKRSLNKRPLTVTVRHDIRDLSGTSMVGTFQVQHYNGNVEAVALELEESWHPLVNSTREAIVHRSAKGRCVLLDTRFTRVGEDGRYRVNFNGKRESQEHRVGYQTMRGIVREFTDPDGKKRYLFQDTVTGKFALPRHADREKLEQFAPQWVGREVDLWYFPAINFRVVSLVDWDNPDGGTVMGRLTGIQEEYLENRTAAMAEGLVAIRLSKMWVDGQRRRSSDTGTSGHWYEEEVRINPALLLAIDPNDLPSLQTLDEETFKVAIRRKKGVALAAVENGRHTLQGVDPHDIRIAYNDAEELLGSFYQQGNLSDLMVEQASYDLAPATTEQPKVGVYASCRCQNHKCGQANGVRSDLDKFGLLGLICTYCKTPLFADLVDVQAWQAEQEENRAEAAANISLPPPIKDEEKAAAPKAAEPDPLKPVVVDIQREQDDDKRKQLKGGDRAAKAAYKKGQRTGSESSTPPATDLSGTTGPASTDSTQQPPAKPAGRKSRTKATPIQLDTSGWTHTETRTALGKLGLTGEGDTAALKQRLVDHLTENPGDAERLIDKPAAAPSPTKKARKAVKAAVRKTTEGPKPPGTVQAQLEQFKEKLDARKGKTSDAEADEAKVTEEAKRKEARAKAAAKAAEAVTAPPAPEGPPAIIPAEFKPPKAKSQEEPKANKKGKAKAEKAPKADAAAGAKAKAKKTTKIAAPKKGRK